jgi:hypothetical protein
MSKVDTIIKNKKISFNNNNIFDMKTILIEVINLESECFTY